MPGSVSGGVKRCDMQTLYLYEGRLEESEVKYVATDDWQRVKDLLVKYLSYEIPLILVEDGDYKGKRELYLKHACDGTPLDPEYPEKTLEHIYYLWDRPIHLETIVNEDKVLFTYDGSQHAPILKARSYSY